MPIQLIAFIYLGLMDFQFDGLMESLLNKKAPPHTLISLVDWDSLQRNTSRHKCGVIFIVCRIYNGAHETCNHLFTSILHGGFIGALIDNPSASEVILKDIGYINRSHYPTTTTTTTTTLRYHHKTKTNNTKQTKKANRVPISGNVLYHDAD